MGFQKGNVPKSPIPRKWESPEDLQKQVDAYFKDCEKRKVAYTMSGLAYFLNTNRTTLLNYEQYTGEGQEWREPFAEIISRARGKCERFTEEMLLSGKNPVGAIFNLKNNYGGWKEEISTEIKGVTSLVALIKSSQPELPTNTVYAELESLRAKELSGENSK